MNHNDWCNLFNLLDSDKSGEIDLGELRTLLSQERTGKLDNISGIEKIDDGEEREKEEEEKDGGEEKEENNNNNDE
jgi:Ca2+-binding EF-hand superfamily protein